MPNKVLPCAATFIGAIFSLTVSIAAASMDTGLQLSNAVVSRPEITIPGLVPREAQNVFINPPGDPSDQDFANNPVFKLNTVEDIQWILDATVTEEVSLFLSVGINTSYAPEPQAIQRKTSGESFKWTVVNAFGALSQMFQLSIRAESSGTILFMSRIFNISLTEVSDSPDLSPKIPASSATAVPNVSALSSTAATIEAPGPATFAATFIIASSTSPTEVPSSESSGLNLPLSTSSSLDSSLTTSATHHGSTTSSTESSPSTQTSNSFFSTTPIPQRTTLISQTSTFPSASPTATALASNSSKSTNSNGQEMAEIALGVALGMVPISIATYCLIHHIKSHPSLFKIGILPAWSRKASTPNSNAKLEPEDPPSTPKRTMPDAAELEGVPIEPAELYGGLREPVELYGGILSPKSCASRVREGIARTVFCPWRSSR